MVCDESSVPERFDLGSGMMLARDLKPYATDRLQLTVFMFAAEYGVDDQLDRSCRRAEGLAGLSGTQWEAASEKRKKKLRRSELFEWKI